MKAFLSHSGNDTQFVNQVAHYLRKGIEIFDYKDKKKDRIGDFVDLLHKELNEASVMIFFIGEKLGKYQIKEIKSVIHNGEYENEGDDNKQIIERTNPTVNSDLKGETSNHEKAPSRQ